MNKFNPWAFGIILLFFLGYFAWNGFKFPILFLGETFKQEAIIYETKKHTIASGKTSYWTQTIRYFYLVEGKWYDGAYTLKPKQAWKEVGNKVSLEVSKSRPHRHKLRAFYKQLSHYEPIHDEYETRQVSGFKKMKIRNDVFCLQNYNSRKDSISCFYGILHKKNDSIKTFMPIIHYYKTKTYLDYQVIDKSLKKRFFKKYDELKFQKDGKSIQLQPLNEIFYGAEVNGSLQLVTQSLFE